jgi:hypothetical protein
MLRRLVALLNNLRIRGQQVPLRTRIIWRWLRTVDRRVRRAVIFDALFCLAAVILTRVFQTNAFARYAFVEIIAVGLYISRLVPVNLWLGEIALKAADRAVTTGESWWDGIRGRLPWWAVWLTGKPDEHQSRTTPAITERHPDTIWHDTSFGGHIFHVLWTVWMWAHVIVYACGFLPVWKNDWLSAIIMIVGMILCFVATEDFVRIKVWRRRLMYVVGAHAAVILLIMVTSLIAPGRYDHLVAKWWYGDKMEESEVVALNRKAEDNGQIKAGLLQEDRELNVRFNLHLDHGDENKYDTLTDCLSYGDCWLPTDSVKWMSNTRRLENMQRSAESGSMSFVDSWQDWVMDHFILTLILIGAAVLLIPTKQSSTSSASH